MASPLCILAKSKGKTLADIGVPSVRIIAAGHRRAGPRVIGRIAQALGLDPVIVSATCDAA